MKKKPHRITEKSENSIRARDKWDIETTKGKMRRKISDMMQIFNFKLKNRRSKGEDRGPA